MKKLLLSFAALLCAATLSAQTEVTFDFDANEWGLPEVTDALNPSTGDIKQSIIKNDVMLVVKYGTGTTSPRMYPAHMRLYSNNVAKIFAPEGKAITKIEFTPDGGDNYYKLSGDGLTDKTWEGNSALVTLKSTATSRLKSMVVTYSNMTSETVIPTEENESVLIDLTEGETDNSELTADYSVTAKADGGQSRVYAVFPKTTATGALVSKNKWYYNTSTYLTALRMFNETITIKTDADKIIKNVKMTLGTYNSGNTINGTAVTKSQLTSGYEVNSEAIDFAIAGQTIIYDITVTLADKPIKPYSPPTAINNVKEEVEDVNAPVYDLSGRKAEGKNLPKGIYVKNGKKFVVK